MYNYILLDEIRKYFLYLGKRLLSGDDQYHHLSTSGTNIFPRHRDGHPMLKKTALPSLGILALDSKTKQLEEIPIPFEAEVHVVFPK